MRVRRMLIDTRLEKTNFDVFEEEFREFENVRLRWSLNHGVKEENTLFWDKFSGQPISESYDIEARLCENKHAEIDV